MKLTTILGRIFAVFGSSALAAVAGGAIFQVELWKSAAIAGVVATGTVVEKLLRAYYEDGKLSAAEVSDIFGSVKAGDE
jgi:hypothetical protein